eukprot:IDg1533t1
MTPGSEATPWSDLDDEDEPEKVQVPQGVTTTSVPEFVQATVHNFPHHVQRPIPIRAATFPAFKTPQPDPLLTPQIGVTQPPASGIHQPEGDAFLGYPPARGCRCRSLDHLTRPKGTNTRYCANSGDESPHCRAL